MCLRSLGLDGHKHTGFTIPQLFDPRDQTGDYEQQLSFRWHTAVLI